MIKLLLKTIYGQVVFPELKQLVESTESQWDDRMLSLVDEAVRALLS